MQKELVGSSDGLPEIAAQEIWHALAKNKFMLHAGDTQIPLPHNGIFPFEFIHSHVQLRMNIACNTLASFICTPFEQIGKKAYLYNQFGFDASYSPESKLVRITRSEVDVPVFTGQTVLNYDDVRAIKLALATIALAPSDLWADIQEHGAYISALHSVSEATLAIPGRFARERAMHTFSWEPPWMDDVLYVVDLSQGTHEIFVGQHKRDDAQLRDLLTAHISPVFIQVNPTATSDFSPYMATVEDS